MKPFEPQRFIETVEAALKKKNIHGIVLQIASKDDTISLTHAAGNLQPNSRYYIASINKLIISALVLRLIDQNRLSFEDRLIDFVEKDMQNGLHVIDGIDRTGEITILHMLSQTSGLPCYLSDKPKNQPSAMDELIAGIDRPWPIEEIITRVRQLPAHFVPGRPNKAKYIDTNHQFLSLVIEKIEQHSIKDIIQDVFEELKMSDSHVCTDVHDTSYVFPFYKDDVRDIRNYTVSTHTDIISTCADQMRFIKAFMAGHFWPKDKLHELESFNKIFFPFKYGIGIQQFYTPRIFSPLKPLPDMIGHCGSTGSVMFYVKHLNLYFCGTTNQQSNPSAMFQTIMKILYQLI